MKKFLSVLLAVMMVLSTVSFAAPSAVGTMDAYTAPVEAEAFEEADLAEDFAGKYGEIVFTIDFENAEVGEIDLSSGVKITDLGATINPAYPNAAKFKLQNHKGNYYTEILDDASNYLYYTGVAGTSGLIMLSGASLTDKSGAYILACDLDYYGSHATPITTRFTAQSTLTPAVENAGTDVWNTEKNEYGFGEFVARSNDLSKVLSISNIDTFKFFGNTGVTAADEFYIDNITLYYVSDTATVTVDMGDKGEDVVVENYPTKGLTVAELAAYVPYVDGYKVAGFSATEGGEALSSLAVGGNTTLYVVWEKQYPYGDLLFEINFDKATLGELNFNTDAKYISNLGGFFGSAATCNNLFIVNGANASSALDTAVKARANGDNYLELTYNIAGGNNMIYPRTTGKSDYFKNDEDGYLVLTYDVLVDSNNTSGAPARVAFNENNERENNVNAIVNAEAGKWTTAVAYYEADSIGLAGSGGNATTITTAKQINLIKIQAPGSAKIDEVVGIDNIRLFWKPKTAKLTIKIEGQDDVVINDYPTDGMTSADLAAKLPAVSGKKLMGFALNPDGELLINTKIARDTVVYPVYEEVEVLEGSLEFNSADDLNKITFRTGKNNSLGAGFASIKENSYMSVSFVGEDTTCSIQDTGMNFKSINVPAGKLVEMEMRVRFTGMPTELIKLPQIGGSSSNVNPEALGWPEMYYTTGGVFTHFTSTTQPKLGYTNIKGKDGQWFTITLSAADLNATDLTTFRFDFYDYMPSGSTFDIDYIRFIGKAEEEVVPEVPVCDNCGGEHETADCPNVEVPEEVIDPAFVEKYGYLVFSYDFEKMAAGAVDYDSLAKKWSGNTPDVYGGKVNSAFYTEGMHFMLLADKGTSTTVTVKNDATHGNYLEYVSGVAGGGNNLVWAGYLTSKTEQFIAEGSKFADGYLVATVDFLNASTNGNKTGINLVFNAEPVIGAEIRGKIISTPELGKWGTMVSVLDAASIDANAKLNAVTDISRLKINHNTDLAVGDTFAIDNLKLYWVPKTVDVTVVKGSNASVSDFTKAVCPVDTVADLMKLVPAGNMMLAGLSTTEGGELLANNDLLSFLEATTLYPTWVDVPTVTVDMGENKTATPVSVQLSATTTVADIAAKIVDHGDKKFVGLARTEGGSVLSGSELVSTGTEDVVLYAVWEDYEYLTYYSVEFDGDFGKYRVIQNNAQSSYKTENGILTLKSVPVAGYQATWDQQVFADNFTAETALPAGVVSQVVVRMRYRNLPTEAKKYTIQNRADTAFDPNNAPAYVHAAKYGATKWGELLQSTNRGEKNLVDGQWFTRYLDADTFFKEGIAYFRFDTPYPLPAGVEVDYDFIRFIGDNEDERIPATAVESKIMPNFSTEFTTGNDGFSFVSWRKKDDDGNVTHFSEDATTVGGKDNRNSGDSYLTWNEDGYVTFNFDATDEAKAAAEAQGMRAAIWDSVAYFKALDKTTCLNAGALDKIQMRMRFRNVPTTNTALWSNTRGKSETFNANAPFYFHAMNNTDAIDTAGIAQLNAVDKSYVVDGAIANDSWFVVELPASFFKADVNVLDLLRLDFTDAMPDGAKVDIDYIRFYGVEDVIESVGPVEKPEEPEVPAEKEPGAGDDVRATYSAEFNNGEDGVSLVSWKNADGSYKYDDGVNGDFGVGTGSAFIGDAEDYITWNEEGFVTLNFVANEEVKAAAAAKGATAYVYDASAYVASLDEAAVLEAGSFDELKIRMRLRDLPANGTALYGLAYSNWKDATWSLDDVNSHFYFHYSNVVGGVDYAGATATPKAFDDISFTEGSYVADEWFEVTIPASYFKADVSPLEILRLNIPDYMPDGSKIDIDYIRFVNDDADFTPATKNEVSLRATDPAGLRFKAAMSAATNAVAYEYGWLAADADRVSTLEVGATGVLVGYGREDGVDVKKFFEEDDTTKIFSLVVTNIKAEYSERKLSVRPFVNVDGEYYYGDTITKSVKDIAQELLDTDAELSDDVKAFLESVVNYNNP